MAALTSGRETWPDWSFDEAAFRAYLTERPTFQPAHAPDLLLCFLCLSGHSAALRTFDRDHFEPLRSVLSAIDGAPVGDVMQELRLKLLAERRLGQYQGRGTLQGWLRRAAVNTASHVLEPVRREERLEFASAQIIVPDPELTLLKKAHRDAFRAAFVEALKRLTVRERTVLRLNALSGLSIDALGQMYGVHRATAARWVHQAKENVVNTTRALLAENIKESALVMSSFMRLLRSELDVSLRKHLDDGSPSDENLVD